MQAQTAWKQADLPSLACRLNAAEMFIDVAKTDMETSTNWVAESGVLDLFLLLGPTPHQVHQLIFGLKHDRWALQT